MDNDEDKRYSPSRDANKQMDEDIDRSFAEQQKLFAELGSTPLGSAPPHYHQKPPSWNRKATNHGHLKVFGGISIWLVMSYIGASYFPTIADYFAISGFVVFLLIIESDLWYPRFRRWRRGV